MPAARDDTPREGVLRVRLPAIAERLADPHGAGVGSGRAPGRSPPRARLVPPSATPNPEREPVSLFKRIERYFSAFFKLGRTAKTAKAAQHSVSVLEPRLDSLAQELYELNDRQVALEGMRDWIDALEQRLGEGAHRIEEVRTEARDTADELRSGQSDVRRGFDAALERIAGLEERVSEISDALRRSSEDAHTRLAAIERNLGERMRPELDGFAGRLEGFERRVDRVAGDVAQSARAYSELSRRLDLQRFRGGEAARDPAPEGPPAREGLDALLESFYGRLEDRYRGSREEIKRRLAVYLPDIAAAREAAGGRAVLDLGCGRGEWVELLTEQGHAAEGIDLNPVQIAEAEAAGLPVRQGDALAALAEAPDNAYAAVTAHHLVEHLPFETVGWMTREALRVLAPGGVLIYETPNPRNLIVGATTFHLDPTHRRPMPAEVLTTLLDTAGYHPVEARPLHPSETLGAFRRDARADPYIAELLFGPQDLAVLATKPAVA